MTTGDLQIRGLNSYYGSAHILFDIDFDVTEGDTLAVLGRNGAGKTTLLKSLVNAEVHTTGSIRYGDETISNWPSHRIARAGVQLVPDDRRILARLTVRQNLELAGRAASADRPPIPISRLKEQFPMLEDLLDRPGYALSGGEQQLMAIARAMVANPTLLLLDEPSEGLAPLIVEEVGHAIQGLQSEFGLTVVVAEQNVRFILELAKKICLIDGGSVVWNGPIEDFTSNEELQRKYLAV